MFMAHKFFEAKDSKIIISEESVKEKKALVSTKESEGFLILKPLNIYLGKENQILVMLAMFIALKKGPPHSLPITFPKIGDQS